MVQNEVVNTLIKKQPLWVVFFKEIKMLMVTFFPFFFPPAVLSLFGIHIHFGFDLLSSLNEFIQTM